MAKCKSRRNKLAFLAWWYLNQLGSCFSDIHVVLFKTVGFPIDTIAATKKSEARYIFSITKHQNGNHIQETSQCNLCFVDIFFYSMSKRMFSEVEGHVWLIRNIYTLAARLNEMTADIFRAHKTLSRMFPDSLL